MADEVLFRHLMRKECGHEPTAGQEDAIVLMSQFLYNNNPRSLFVLKGYAGTGKTTLLSALVNTLPHVGMKVVLLAPTGRAAKVLGNYSGQPAGTIHRNIYWKVSTGGVEKFVLRENKWKNTLFIVDEASMIMGEAGSPDQHVFGSGNLLEDLFGFVYGGENCRILFSGDTAQLPPVGSAQSPALDEKFLSRTFYLEVYKCELTEVVRQAGESGILHNATMLREMIRNEAVSKPVFNTGSFRDFRAVYGSDLEELLNAAYSAGGVEETIVICRSNKNANLYNAQIRARIRYQEEELSAGDHLMVVKNNYTWLPPESKAGFIANGDTIIVSKVKSKKNLYGLRFADILFSMADYPDEPEREARIVLNTLTADGPALSRDDSNRMYQSMQEFYSGYTNKRERFLKIKADPCYNALQVKFAYAITCHKAQGGQWENVFIDQGYMKDEMLNLEYLRWLYTAVTRGSKKVALVNFGMG
ncbi:MAG: AAA family ATPase [Bacteroidia bacterium]|nr:AAA family ATPase [Bacteroidia bacterium]